MLAEALANGMISIHAPRTGSDGFCGDEQKREDYFNPRSPYGERLSTVCLSTGEENFNPRSPYGERLVKA